MKKVTVMAAGMTLTAILAACGSQDSADQSSRDNGGNTPEVWQEEESPKPESTEKFASSDLPPTYFCYGTRDPFVSEFEECIEALKEADVPVEVNILEGRPHGYGYMEGWIPDYDVWLTGIFEKN